MAGLRNGAESTSRAFWVIGLVLAVGNTSLAEAVSFLGDRSSEAAWLLRTTAGVADGFFVATSVSAGASVCATTRPLLITPRPPTKLSPCIRRGYR